MFFLSERPSRPNTPTDRPGPRVHRVILTDLPGPSPADTPRPSRPSTPLNNRPRVIFSELPGPSRPSIPLPNTPWPSRPWHGYGAGFGPVQPELGPDYVGSKLERLREILDGGARAKDKLRWLNKIEDSISDSTGSTDKEQLDMWNKYIDKMDSIHINPHLSEKEKKIDNG